MEPFIGQLMLIPYTFAPVGWLFCQGQLLAISQYSPLYNLIGTTYGGDGQVTFALPDLRGRTPIGYGQGPGLGNYVIGQTVGVETVTLITTQLPTHTHTVAASGNPTNSSIPNGTFFGATSGAQAYGNGGSSVSALAPASVTALGGNQPHDNLQPYLTLNWIIAMEGIYPSQG